MNRAPRLLSYLACAVLAGGCCRAVAEKAVDLGTDGAVKIADGGVTIKTDGGTLSTNGDGTLPGDWPTDVPLYPGGKIQIVNHTDDVRTLIFSTTDHSSKVTAFYKSSLPGWTATMDTTGPDGGIARKQKGKNVLTLNISKTEDGTTVISIAVGPSGP